MKTYVLPYQTILGTGWLEATEKGVSQVCLPGDERLSMEKQPDCLPEHAVAAVSQLEDYFKGRLHSFDLPLDLGRLTEFQQKVLLVAAAIPYGKVISYGRLAELAGYPKAARAAGGVMAANRLPVIIPCHRVVASSGALTGYSGAGGLDCKKFLLTMEGIEFKGKNVCHIFDSY